MTQTHTPNLGLLDMSIDDIDDLPGFEVPVNGVYSLKFWTQVKIVNNKDCVEQNFEVIECLEQNDAGETATKVGVKFSMLAQLGNEIAEGKMKAIMLPIAAHFGERNMLKLITDTCSQASGVIITAKVKRRADKEDKDRFYADVSNVVVA